MLYAHHTFLSANDKFLIDFEDEASKINYLEQGLNKYFLSNL